MDDWRTARWLVAATLLMLGAAAVELVDRPPASRPPLPSSVAGLAARLSSHPTDWLAACALTEKALDGPSPHRIELWHAAHAQALMLAPNRPEPQEAFVRSGFFHWTEISGADRKAVLEAMEPLLRNPPMWNAMAPALFDLTGDLAMLRRAQPHTEGSISWLLALAATNGRFEDYRSLRAELQKKRLDEFLALAPAASPRGLIDAFPQPPYRKDSEPLIVALLQQLHRRPLDEDPGRSNVIEGIVDYALRHDLGPLDGLEVLIRKEGWATAPTRLRLARKLGVSQADLDLEMTRHPPAVRPPASDWKGLCESMVCDRAWREIASTGSILLTLAPAKMDEVPPYAEIYLDDVLVSEGEVATRRDFVLPSLPGNHELELRLANPMTRNGSRREIRILSVKAEAPIS